MIEGPFRTIGVGAVCLLVACGASTGISSAGTTDGGVDAAPATCALPVRHEGISGGSTMLMVGTGCDQLAVCAEGYAAQSTIGAASSRMTCADATLPECGGPGCYYRLGATRLVTARDVDLFCSLADSIPELVCTIWGP